MTALPDWIIGIIALVYPAIEAPPATLYNGYVEGDFAYVAAAVPGRITAIAVAEGQTVAAGDLLFSLDDTRQRAALAGAEAQLAAAQANLDNLATGGRADEIDVIRSSLASAEANRNLAQANLSRDEALLARGAVAQAAVDREREALAAAEAQVAMLEAQLRVAELPARDAQRRAAEANVAAAEASVAAARSDLADRTVTAAVAGTVERRYFDLGEVAGAGIPVVSILPPDQLKVIFFIPEDQLPDFAMGATMTLGCDGCSPGMTATITRIENAPQFTPPIIYSRDERGRLVFAAEARLAPGLGLLPGQPVTLEQQE